MIFKKSDKFNEEYCCSIVRVGEVIPIENSDFLALTKVNGESIVVRKDQVKEGDILFYASNETQLNKDFLSINNLFEWQSRELNSNYNEVEQLIIEDKIEEAKRKVGFFNKHGRVRSIKLRGVQSMGYLFGLNELIKFNPKIRSVDIKGLVGQDFDEIDGVEFIKMYIPYVPEKKPHSNKRNNKLKRFDRLIKGEFQFHYDTAPLPKNIQHIKPDDVVVISVKIHGTSAIFANIKVKQPIKLPIYQRIWNKFVDLTGLGHRIIDYEIVYDNIYSSRSVIKNQYINESVKEGYYNVDLWQKYNDMLKPYIPQGMTLYGEICGYVPNTNTLIQKDYDYGCLPGESYLMPYRITTTNDDGSKNEWNVEDVIKWVKKLLKEHPDVLVKAMTILYHGTLRDLYPDINVNWHENVLDRMRKDFGLEKQEPMCDNKVPREGIVLRIDDDPCSEAFKLKSQKFLDRERKLIDEGQIDIELNEKASLVIANLKSN